MPHEINCGKDQSPFFNDTKSTDLLPKNQQKMTSNSYNPFSIIPSCLAEKTEFKRMSGLEKKMALKYSFLSKFFFMLQSGRTSKGIFCVHTKTWNQLKLGSTTTTRNVRKDNLSTVFSPF